MLAGTFHRSIPLSEFITSNVGYYMQYDIINIIKSMNQLLVGNITASFKTEANTILATETT